MKTNKQTSSNEHLKTDKLEEDYKDKKTIIVLKHIEKKI